MSTASKGQDSGVTRFSNGQATVITPINKNVLLAVTGTKPDPTNQAESLSSSPSSSLSAVQKKPTEAEEYPQRELETLMSVTNELTCLLRAELSEMRWPEDF